MSEQNIFQKSEAGFINKTLMNMAIGLFITFIVAYFVSSSSVMLNVIFANAFIPIILGIMEIGLVFYLSRNIEKLSFTQARMWFFVYSVLNGLTFSIIFLVYTAGSIASVFIVAAAMFFCCSMIGITTKVNLSTFGRVLIMALVGLIVVSIINVFLGSAQLDFTITIAGIVIFCGLTAYDMQKIKHFHQNSYYVDRELVDKFSIVAALTLYLDFINLFIYLLRLFGKKD